MGCTDLPKGIWVPCTSTSVRVCVVGWGVSALFILCVSIFSYQLVWKDLKARISAAQLVLEMFRRTEDVIRQKHLMS